MNDERERAIRELVAQWLARAEADLAVARLTDDERISPEILAFHAQQAVEKGLKTLLVQRQVEFPHIHAIGALLRLCESAGYADVDDWEEAATLTRYAVAARYPAAEEPVSRKEAGEAAELATRVIDWVKSQIDKSAQ
jgi:HEPN domain-containing protein